MYSKLDAEKYHFNAVNLYQSNGHEKSVLNFKRAILKDPQNGLSYSTLGRYFNVVEKKDIAIRYYEKGILIDHNDINNYINLAKIFESQGVYDKAVSIYAKYLIKEPDNNYIPNLYGMCLLTVRKYAEAIEIFNRILEINPKHCDAYNNWAVALYEQMDYDAACTKWAKVIELNGKYIEAYLNMGLALYQQKKNTEAVEMVQKGISFLDSRGKKQYVKAIEKEISTYKAGISSLTEKAQMEHSERNMKSLREIINLLINMPESNEST